MQEVALETLQADKAGKGYWDVVWTGAPLPTAVDPRATNLGNYVHRRYHAFFSQLFSSAQARGKRLLEVGCAMSATLPYFAKEFGLEVYGIDYSELGCRQALQILRNEGVQGEILCADLFAPPAQIIEQFDFVVSFGVVEHFVDTARCLEALGRCLKPGGILITSIPNMTGLVGTLQKLLNRPVFEKHVPLDREALKQAHQQAGLEALHCDYLISTEFGVCNLNGISPGSVEWRIKQPVLTLLSRCSALVWLVEQKLGEIRRTRALSPYVVCTARKPAVS